MKGMLSLKHWQAFCVSAFAPFNNDPATCGTQKHRSRHLLRGSSKNTQNPIFLRTFPPWFVAEKDLAVYEFDCLEERMKRDIFTEMLEGLDALAGELKTKSSHPTRKIHLNKLAAITATELIEIREQLQLSRPAFAMYLRVNAKTLENWEHGRAKPNPQATTLIRLVQQYPETVEHLAALN